MTDPAKLSAIKKFAKTTEAVEALSWLEGQSRTSERFIAEWSHAQSAKLVKRLYGFGCRSVWATQFGRNGSYESAQILVLELPPEPDARRSIFDFVNALSVEQGYDEDPDDGRTLWKIWFD